MAVLRPLHCMCCWKETRSIGLGPPPQRGFKDIVFLLSCLFRGLFTCSLAGSTSFLLKVKLRLENSLRLFETQVHLSC